MARRRYVSIKEVAARAGVSFQTASKVLNGGDVRVSGETEERILAAAAELGYRPNTIARSLVQRATATIGLVASDATDVAIAQASVAAEQAARKNGHSVLVGHLAAGGADGADIVRTLIERRVDGIIAAAPEVEEDTEVADLLRRYVPSVSLQAVPGGGVPLVGSNHRETGRLAATHLLGLGHTSIGTVTGTFRRRVTRSRLHGYEDALRDAGLEPSEDLVAEGDWTPQGGAVATRLLLERSPGLTAIFVHSDVMAIGVLSALWQAGRQGARGRRGGELRRHPVRRVPDAAAEHRADPAGGDRAAGGRVAAAQHRGRAGARADAAAAGGADRPRFLRRAENPHDEGAPLTRIAIDPARPVGRLDRKVFGGFVEHLGRCIYGGLYEEGSPLSDDRGFRKDVLGLLRELRLGVLRWPGGNFVSNYHWADGIGPEGQPGRAAPSWPGAGRNPTGSAPTSTWPTAPNSAPSRTSA